MKKSDLLHKALSFAATVAALGLALGAESAAPLGVRALRIAAPPLRFVGTGPGAGPAPAQRVHKRIHAAPLRFVGRGPAAATHR